MNKIPPTIASNKLSFVKLLIFEAKIKAKRI